MSFKPLVVSDQLKFATSASADGRFLLYVTIDPQTNYDLWVQPMADPSAPGDSALEPGTPVVLFPTRIVGGGVDVEFGRQYDVAPDGRFLINMELVDRECGRFS